MIYAILITGAFLAWYKLFYLKKHHVETHEEYLDRIYREYEESRMNAQIEAALQAEALRKEKQNEKERKAEEARELARMEMEHRETLRAVFDRQYEELCEALEGANDKHRPVIGRKIDALDERRFKNELAIAKLSYKARG